MSSHTEASPAPWLRTAGDTQRSGAILIQDADGEIIGWATDAAGHTTEAVQPDRRLPSQIEANAALMALAPQMAEVCRLVAEGDLLDLGHLLQARRQAQSIVCWLELGLPAMAPATLTGALHVAGGAA